MPTHETSIELIRLQLASSRVALFLRALGNPSRLLLLCQLTKGEKNVNELETLTGVKQPTLSQQLAVLREEGLVHTRKDGKHVFYTIQSEAALAVIEALHQHFGSAEEIQKTGPQI